MTHEIQSLTGVVYATTAGKELLADLHLPMTNQPVPAIIFIHDAQSDLNRGGPIRDLRRFLADALAMLSSLVDRVSRYCVRDKARFL